MKNASFKLFFATNALLCLAGALTRSFPSWGMFERIEPVQFRLTDSQGVNIPVENYLPRDALILRVAEILPVLRFICLREEARDPLHFVSVNSGLDFFLEKGKCEIPR